MTRLTSDRIDPGEDLEFGREREHEILYNVGFSRLAPDGYSQDR